MNIIVVIVIVLVVAMVIGPVAMLRPSPAQKRRDALRARARQLGLSVHLRVPPATATASESAGHMPAYCLHSKSHAAWQLLRTDYAHDLHLAQWWQFAGAKPAPAVQDFLVNELEHLPKGVVAITANYREVAVFWREWGEVENVDAIAQFLRQLGQD